MIRQIFGIAALAALAACAYTPSVKTDFAPGTNFGQYRSFKVLPGRIVSRLGVMDTTNTLANDRIGNAVAGQLTAKGLVRKETAAELYVTFLAGAKDKTEVESVPAGPSYYGAYGYWGRGAWGGVGHNEFWTRKYQEGTLIIDLIDAKTKSLVWRSYCVGEMSKDADENRNRLNSCLQQSFAQFPPGTAAK